MNTTVNDGIDEVTKRKIVAIIAALIPDAAIYLFGSRARGTQSQWSDIDIALDAGHPISRLVIGEVMSMLEASNILFKIQIVDTNSVNEAMRASILRDRVLWNK
jgi:predicted nucleotidyltransferase